MSNLQVRNVSLTLGNDQVLQNISFSLKANAKLALFGPNGAGKTSLLHAILGLHKFSGQIKIGEAITGTKEARQKIFYLPERFKPHPFLSGKEYLKIFQSKQGDESSPFLNQKISTHSKGMMQQLGLYLIQNSSASLFLLDEPSSGLDIFKKEELNACLKGIKRTLVISGHDLHFLREVTDHLLVLDKKVLYYGPFPEVKNQELEQWIFELFNQEDCPHLNHHRL